MDSGWKWSATSNTFPPPRYRRNEMRAHSCLAVLLTAAFACQPADTTASAKQGIDAANAQWPRLTSTGHADSLAEFYAIDAVMMPPNMATVKGKDAIRAFFATMNTIDPRPTLTLHADAVHGAGAMAMERGRSPCGSQAWNVRARSGHTMRTTQGTLASLVAVALIGCSVGKLFDAPPSKVIGVTPARVIDSAQEGSSAPQSAALVLSTAHGDATPPWKAHQAANAPWLAIAADP